MGDKGGKKDKEKVLEIAFEKHPNRFKGKVPKPMALPKAIVLSIASKSSYARIPNIPPPSGIYWIHTTLIST